MCLHYISVGQYCSRQIHVKYNFCTPPLLVLVSHVSASWACGDPAVILVSSKPSALTVESFVTDRIEELTDTYSASQSSMSINKHLFGGRKSFCQFAFAVI